MLGLAVTALVVLGLVGIGIGALVAPRASSAQYGIVVDDPRALAFIRAMGVRDLVLGAVLALLAAAGRPGLLAIAMGASSAIAWLDYAVVAADPRARQRARLLHGGGAVGLLVAALLIASGR